MWPRFLINFRLHLNQDKVFENMIFLFGNESHFLGRLIRSPALPKERGVWNSQGGRKVKFFFFPFYIP